MLDGGPDRSLSTATAGLVDRLASGDAAGSDAPGGDAPSVDNRRRTVLRAVALAGSTGLSGCLGGLFDRPLLADIARRDDRVLLRNHGGDPSVTAGAPSIPDEITALRPGEARILAPGDGGSVPETAGVYDADDGVLLTASASRTGAERARDAVEAWDAAPPGSRHFHPAPDGESSGRQRDTHELVGLADSQGVAVFNEGLTADRSAEWVDTVFNEVSSERRSVDRLRVPPSASDGPRTGSSRSPSGRF